MKEWDTELVKDTDSKSSSMVATVNIHIMSDDISYSADANAKLG